MNRWSTPWLILLATVLPVPGMAQAEGMSLRQIAEAHTVTQARISPDGGEIAYVLSVPRQLGKDDDGPAFTQLHVVDAGGESRLYVSGKSGVRSIAWLPDGSGITFLSKREDAKFASLYRIPLRGGDARELAALKSDIVAYSLSPDGAQVALVARAPEDEAQDKLRKQGFNQKVFEQDWRAQQLWVKDLRDAEAEPRLIELEQPVQDVHWSPAGDRLAIIVTRRQLVDDTLIGMRVRIIAPDGRELGRVDNPGKLGAVAWSPDGEHLAIISAQDESDPREGRLTVVGKDGGVQRDLVPGLEGHILNVAWRDARRLLFVSHEGTTTRLGEVGVDGRGQRTVLAGDGTVWAELSAGARGDLALVGNSPAHPNEVFRLGRSERAARRLTDSNPWLAEVRLARQEVVRYKARDGLEIEGILFHPLHREPGQRVPLILIVHGGPESHYSNGWLTTYGQPAQHAAARGFAVFLPNYRASTGRGVAFSKLNHGRPAREEFDDLVDGVDHLIDIGLVDRARVGVTGGSYGGYATAWCATWYSERFAAAVSFVGLSDNISALGTSDIPQELYQVHYRIWPWENWSLFTESSPIHHAHKSRTPTLILHGDADPRVDPTQSRILYRYLSLAGQAPVRLVLYPGEGHGNQRAASRWDYSLRLMGWMEHYLQGPGGEPPPQEIDYQLPSGEESEKPD